MAAGTRELRVLITGLNNSQSAFASLNRDLNRSQTGITGFGRTLTTVGQSMTRFGRAATLGITLPIVAAVASAAKGASDLNESMQKVSVVFGSSAQEVYKWSEGMAQAFGMSMRQADEAASNIGLFGSKAGLTGHKLVEFSTGLVQLAGDMASFNNDPNPDKAINAILSSIRGMQRPIRAYGVGLDLAAVKQEAMSMGLYHGEKAFSQQAKTLATVSLIMKETDKIQGDFARTQGFSAQKMKILTAEVLNARDKLGQLLLPAVIAILSKMTEWVGKFNALSDSTKKWILIVAGVVAAIGPVVSILGALFIAIGFILSPIGMVVIAIAALVAGFIYAYQHFADFRAKVDEVVAWLKANVPLAFEWVKTKIGEAVDAIQRFWAKWGDDIKRVAGEVVNWLTTNIPKAFEMIKNVISGVASWLSANVPKAFEVIKDAAADVVAWFTSGNFVRAFDLVKSILQSVISWVGDHWRQGWEILKSVVSTVINAVAPIVRTGLELVKSAIKIVLDLIHGDWGKAWDEMKTIPSKFVKFVWATITGMGSLLMSAGKLAFNLLKLAIVAAVPPIMDFVKGIPGKAVAAIGKLGSLLFNAGADLIRGLGNGIKSMAGWLVTQAKDTVTGIPGKVMGWLGIHSPSVIMIDVGENFGRGLGIGIKNSGPEINTAAKLVADSMSDITKSTVNAKTPELSSAGEKAAKALTGGLSKGVKTAKPKMMADLDDLANDVSDKFGSSIAAAISAAEQKVTDSLSAIFAAIGGGKSLDQAKRSQTTAEKKLADLRQSGSTIADRIAKAEARLADARAHSAEITAEEQVAIDDANDALEEAKAKFAAGEITASQLAVAEHRLAAAKAAATEATSDETDAANDLKKLQDEQASLVDDIADAERALSDAIDAVTDAQLANYKNNEDLRKQGPDVLNIWAQYAAAAGLSATQIDRVNQALAAQPGLMAAAAAAAAAAASAISSIPVIPPIVPGITGPGLGSPGQPGSGSPYATGPGGAIILPAVPAAPTDSDHTRPTGMTTGMANGGFVRSRWGGHRAIVGEGGEDEIVSPVPMLRQIIREESGRGGVRELHLHFEGNIGSEREATLMLGRALTELRSKGYDI